jgi:Amt family ammonium transporter
VAYWLFGFALAYGDGNSVIGYTHWAGIGVDYGKMADWFFQCIFAATAATIVSGAVAERCNYVAYITYSFVISGTAVKFIIRVTEHPISGNTAYNAVSWVTYPSGS